MNTTLYDKLTGSGGYSLPYLLDLFDADGNHIRLINDTHDKSLAGVIYHACAFEYSPQENGESTLKVEIIDNEIINLLENNYNFEAQIVGVLLEDGTVQEIKTYRHQYGNVTWDGKEAHITFEEDDRFKMTFPSLIWTTYNNRGNA